MAQSTTIVAFDQHAATTVAAVLPGTPDTSAAPDDVGRGDAGRFVERLRRQGPVQCCYEAGPCGFELQRYLGGRKFRATSSRPALIPRRAGDRIKTDRRDARSSPSCIGPAR